MTDSFTLETEKLIDQLLHILYYFRGALSRDDVYAMSPGERDKTNEFINKRFKEVGEMMKKQIPVFY